MTFQHLSQAQFDEIIHASMALNLWPSRTQDALLEGIDPVYVATLNLDGLPPALRLRSTLRTLNGDEQLSDGSVPLQIWLGNAVAVAPPKPPAEVLRRVYSEISRRLSGAPPIPAAGELPEVKEAIVHQDDMLPFVFLERGHRAGAAVARLTVPRYEGGQPRLLPSGAPQRHRGTTWLLTERLLITNFHVVNARGEGEPTAADSDLRLQAASALVHFDVDQEGAVGTEATVVRLEAHDPSLDYAVLRLAQPADRPPLGLSREPLLLATGQGASIPVNIIQHPDGRAKMIACRNNLATAGDMRGLRYLTDTRQGSSGSPVLNDLWLVVALHRASVPVQPFSFQGRKTAFVNCGTQITAVLEDLRGRAPVLLQEIESERA